MCNDSKKNNPLVSIIIPAYNCEKFIEETVNSCLKQTYQNIEIICIDDCSSDDTFNVLKSLSISCQKLTVAQMPFNSKPAAVRNLAIKMSNGSYILPLDGDDLISPSYIARAITVFIENPSISVVYCKANYFGEKTGEWQLPPFDELEIIEKNMVHCSALYRKNDWLKLGGYCENLIHGREDWDFWLQFVKRKMFFYRIPEVLFFYRQLPKSRSSFLTDTEKVKNTSKLIYRRNVILHIRKMKREGSINSIKMCKMILSSFYWRYFPPK